MAAFRGAQPKPLPVAYNDGEEAEELGLSVQPWGAWTWSMAEKDPASQSDLNLVVAARAGDRMAFAELIERYQGQVSSIIYAITGSQGDDVAHETFVAAWKKLHVMKRPELFGGWVCGIAQNMARRFRRARHRQASGRFVPLDGRQQLASQLASDDPSPLDHVISEEEEQSLWDALREIPAEYRLPLVLFYQEQQSVKKVAEALELSSDNVRQRLTRGRRMLQQKISFVEAALPKARSRRRLAGIVLASLGGEGSSASAAVPQKRGAAARALRLMGAVTLPAALCAVAYLGTAKRQEAGPPSAVVAKVSEPRLLVEAPSRLAAAPAGAQRAAGVSPGGGGSADAVLDFDFEDGALPPVIEQGHVVPGPPGSPSRHCLMGTVTVTSPRSPQVILDRGGPPLFFYSEGAVLSFDYWVGDDYRTDTGEAVDLSISVRDQDARFNFFFFVREPVTERWAHFEQPLSAFTKEGRRMEPGDRILHLNIGGGWAGGKPFYVDNVKLVVSPIR